MSAGGGDWKPRAVQVTCFRASRELALGGQY